MDAEPVVFVTDDYALLHQEESVLDPIDIKILRESNVTKVTKIVSTIEALERLAEHKPELKQAREEGGFNPLLPGGVEVEPTRFQNLLKLASETDVVLNAMISGNMSRKVAEEIRELRVQEPHHSWRAIARACHNTNQFWTWQPSSNQIAGMVLCKHAAEQFGEDYREEPWN